MTTGEARRGAISSSLLPRIAVPVLALAGLGVSGYLTYVHYALIEPVCVFNAKCDEVLASPHAQMWGVPLALLGMVMYAVVIVLSLLLWRRESVWEHPIALGIYGVTLTGMVFTGYLYYLEISVLHAFCSWCVISSIILAIIFIISIINFVSKKRRLESAPHTRRLKLSDIIGW
jgi:uncharacterized membrane protein